MSETNGSKTGKKEWNDRAADALRANLRRRKQQKKGTPSPEAESDDHQGSDEDQERNKP